MSQEELNISIPLGDSAEISFSSALAVLVLPVEAGVVRLAEPFHRDHTLDRRGRAHTTLDPSPVNRRAAKVTFGERCIRSGPPNTRGRTAPFETGERVNPPRFITENYIDAAI